MCCSVEKICIFIGAKILVKRVMTVRSKMVMHLHFLVPYVFPMIYILVPFMEWFVLLTSKSPDLENSIYYLKLMTSNVEFVRMF